MVVRRVLASTALASATFACTLVGPPHWAYAAPPAPPAPAAPSAPAAPTASLSVEVGRPTFTLGESVEVGGRVADPSGAPVVSGLVLVIIDRDASDPVQATTDANGHWHVAVPPRPTWVKGPIEVEAAYVMAPDASIHQATTFTLSAPGIPVNLAVQPVGGPVTQGQDVELTGTLTLPDGRPVVGQSVYLMRDGDGTAEGFASTNDRGEWRTRFRVPDAAGANDAAFPAYSITVHFDGDSGGEYGAETAALSAAQAPATMTLAGPPVTRVTPAPTPTSLAPTSSGVRTTAAQAVRADAPAAPVPASLPTQSARAAFVSMPSVTSPGLLLLLGGSIATVAGAAMLSHAARLRSA